MKRKLLVALSTFVLCALLLPVAAFAEDYDLWVGDVQVTSENAADVFEDGTVKFDASSSTLYLTDYVATGTETGRSAMLESKLPELTIALDGNNALIGNNEVFGIYGSGNGDITIKDAGKSAVPGTLSITGGIGVTSVGIMNGSGALAINSGTIVAQASRAYSGNSYGVSAKSITINGGALIAQGGPTYNYTAGIFATNFMIASTAVDAFVYAQGGTNLTGSTSYGVWATNSCSIGNGIVIARGGTVSQFDGASGGERLSFAGAEVEASLNAKLAGSTTNGTSTTSAVYVPEGFADGADFQSGALTQDAYYILEDQSEYVALPESLDLNGHTLLSVSLFQYSGDAYPTALAALDVTSIDGPGRFIGVSGMASGNSANSIGIRFDNVDITNADLIGIGGPAGGYSGGIYASSLAATGATNTIAIGGAVSGYGSSEGIGGRTFTFSDVSSAIAVGGLGGTESTGNADSSGIHNSGYLTTEDSAKVLAVANAAEDCSWGTYNTIHAKGGIIATIGGRAGYNSSGNDAGMETYEGGKIIALGGIGDRSSYGTYTGAYPNHGGDIIVAGRTRAYFGDESYYYLSFPEPLTATGYTDYAGTQDETAIASDTPMADVAAFKRVVIAAPKADPTIQRICGENYANETAAAISKQAFDSADTVVLARDDDFADALGATGLAGTLDCPIILTDRTALSEAAATEINRLGATKVYIIGGTGAMKAQLETDLASQCGISDVQRLWGENSYDTSLACAKEIVAKGGHPDIAIIAMSTNFQDALSMSSFAYKYKAPVILQTWGDTSADRGFTDEAAAWLDGKIVVVAGGTGAISNESLAGCTVEARLWGESGYDTSNAIAKWMVENNLLDPTNIIIACGAQDPKGVDALAGAALGGKLGAPMLLVNSNEAMEAADTTTIDDFYTSNASEIKATYVLGGAYVVPQDLYERIQVITNAIDLSA